MKSFATAIRRNGTNVVRSAVLASGLSMTTMAHAGFIDFTIRGTPVINHPVPGQTDFILTQGGQKAALGSNEVNGAKLGSLQSVAITRLDNVTRFLPVPARPWRPT